MEGSISISVGSIIAFVGFLFQLGFTVGAVALAFGSVKQRLASVEEKIREHHGLSTSVTRLEAELEAVGREIKGLREDFRRVLDEFTRVRDARAGGARNP